MTYPKLISWSYRDGRGLFSSKNDKEFINLFYVRNAETEETIKKVGFIPSDALGPDFPGVYRQKEWGYSQRARSHGKIKKKFQKLYPDLEDKFLCKQANNGENLNGAICARLCVDSWVNPLTKEYSEYFLSSKYIKASAFDDTKFVEDLLNYKPLALGSGVIKSYQEELNKTQIDVQILGIGGNGHIGFNEPGTPFDAGVHVVDLKEETIQANSRFFDGDINLVPKQAMTMGIKDIMHAKHIILLAFGKAKQDAIRSLVEGTEITENIPCTVLKNHPSVYVLVDKEADFQ